MHQNECKYLYAACTPHVKNKEGFKLEKKYKVALVCLLSRRKPVKILECSLNILNLRKKKKKRREETEKKLYFLQVRNIFLFILFKGRIGNRQEKEEQVQFSLFLFSVARNT